MGAGGRARVRDDMGEDEVAAFFFDRYQDAWDASLFDCPLCGNRGIFWELDNDDHAVAPARCDCVAGAMLPRSYQRWVENWPAPA